MGQNVERRKLVRHSSASFNRNLSSCLSHKVGRPAPYSSAYADTLNQAELSKYLHGILTSNLPYYTALARYRSKPLRIPRSEQEYKTQRFVSRLTESGLIFLKTQFAKKPKNPV